MKPPRFIKQGETITSDYLNEIVDFVQRNALESSPDILVSHGNRTTLSLPRRTDALGQGGPAAIQHPFQIYQHTPDPENPLPSDWRTFRVRAGTVNNLHPDNDDAQASPVTIVVPESTGGYLVWLECSIEVNEGITQGNILSATIKHGVGGWDGYANQPPGNETNGAPPDKFYILIGQINVQDDTSRLVSVLLQNISTSLGVTMVVVDAQCGEAGFIWVKRMAAWRL